MNEVALRIMGLYIKIERNETLSKQLKVLAFVCLLFSAGCCLSAENSVTVDKDQAVVTNLIWIISIIVLIGTYIKDSNCVKENKAHELDIYRLEIEDLNRKKEVAEIRGEVLSDTLLNKHIDMPSDKVSLPDLYYRILLGIDILIKIYLLLNKIL